MMKIEYFDVDLISPQSPCYIRHNRRFKRLSNKFDKSRTVDYFASKYGKALLKWEFVVQRLLGTLCIEKCDRILKFSNKDTGTNFREIDFIAQPSKDELVFCELKLKEQFNKTLGAKASGWRQLRKSLRIANRQYTELSGLSICVDMSHIYGLETSALDMNYCQFAEIRYHLQHPGDHDQTLWISSQEVTALAIENNLLTLKDIDEIKRLHQEYKNPMSLIKPENFVAKYNPFSVLINLKHTGLVNN